MHDLAKWRHRHGSGKVCGRSSWIVGMAARFSHNPVLPEAPQIYNSTILDAQSVLWKDELLSVASDGDMTCCCCC